MRVLATPTGTGDETANEAAEMTAFEDFVAERAPDGGTVIDLYPATRPETLEAFAKWRKANGR